MAKIETMLQKGAKTAVECLLSICADESQKASDRIGAAKALIDYCYKNGAEDASTLKVILNGMPKEYLV